MLENLTFTPQTAVYDSRKGYPVIKYQFTG